MDQQEATWLKRFLPGVASMAHYDRTWLRSDLVAGVSVAAVAVPVAIAYAQLAGVPPVYGLYASILPLVAYAFMGTSRQLIVAPDAATCAMVATIVAPIAAGNSDRIVPLTMMLTLITGVFCIAGGLARMGFLTNFLARPILTGYLNGIALSIISGQLGRLFGFHLDSAGFFRLLVRFFSQIGRTHVLTLVVGVATFALLRILKHLGPKVPGPLVAMVLGIAASSFFRLSEHGVAMLGLIPAGLPALLIPNIGAQEWGPLVIGAAGLALISFNSAMVTARGFAVKNHYDIDSNQEFVALGVADLGAGLMQGFAVSGADSRTAVNDSVGGKTQVTGLIASGLIVLVLLFLTAPLALLPITVLAAVLVNAALGLFDLESLVTLRKVSRPEFRLSILSTLGVITLGVLPGVAIAVAMAMLLILIRASKPHDAVLGRMAGAGFRDMEIHPEAEAIEGLMIYRFDSSLLFFNSDFFKSRVKALVMNTTPKPRHFLLVAETIILLDTTGAATLEELIEEFSGLDITFAVAQAKRPVRGMLERTGLTQKIGENNLFPTVEAAVMALQPSARAEVV